jgi:hypothetical protein
LELGRNCRIVALILGSGGFSFWALDLVKTMRQVTILAIGLALMASGCDSLRPPADDKASWEYQQNQQIQEAQNADKSDWVWLMWLTMIGAAVTGANIPSYSTNSFNADSSFHSFSK